MAQAQTLAKNHRSAWKTSPRYGLPEANWGFPQPRQEMILGIVSKSLFCYLFILLLSWIFEALTPQSEFLTMKSVLGASYWAPVCLMIGIATVYIKRLSIMRCALLPEEYEKLYIDPSISAVSAPAFTYFKSIDKTHFLSRSDLLMAMQLSEHNSALYKTPALSKHTSRAQEPDLKCDSLPPDINGRLQILMDKKWMGRWWQRALIPTLPVRQWISRSNPQLASVITLFALTLVSLIFLPIAMFARNPSILDYCIVALCVLFQIELLRMTAYFMVSRPVEGNLLNRLDHIIQRAPDFGPLIRYWKEGDVGIRVRDLKSIETLIKQEQPDFFVSFDNRGPSAHIFQSEDKRAAILKAIAPKNIHIPLNEKALKRAKKAPKPWGQFQTLRRHLNHSNFELLHDFTSVLIFPSFTVPFTALFILIVYASIAGLSWAAFSLMGNPLTGTDILFPFGRTAFLIICSALLLLLSACYVILWNAPASDASLSYMFYQDCDEIAYAGQHLSHLPRHQEWRYADMWYARMLMRGPIQKAKQLQEQKEARQRTTLILESPQASEAFAHIDADELEETTLQVSTPVQAPTRRL